MHKILDVIHNTIYQFFDVCDEDEEVPISDKDKLLLGVNKAICNNLKALEQEPKTGHWIVLSATDMYCSECNEIENLDTSRKFCAYCGTRMSENPTDSESEEQA